MTREDMVDWVKSNLRVDISHGYYDSSFSVDLQVWVEKDSSWLTISSGYVSIPEGD